MAVKPRMTLLIFGIIGAVAVIASLEVRGVHALSGVVTFGLLIPLCLLIAGLVPFFLGVLLQCLLHKRPLHPLVSWTTAIFAVTVQHVFSGQTSVMIIGQPIFTFMAAVLIWGVAMDSGVRFCQGWREGNQIGRAAPPYPGG